MATIDMVPDDLPASMDFSLEPADNARLANLSGQFDEHLRHLEQRLGVEINNRGNQFRVIGAPEAAQAAMQVLKELYAATAKERISRETVHMSLSQSSLAERAQPTEVEGGDDPALDTKQGRIRGRGANQRRYLHNIAGHDLNFGIGPAGTGKTYLGVAMAVQALMQKQVNRIVLARPAVEAGEKLGFLPGDLQEKVDPYLRPLYDALFDLVDYERVTKLLEKFAQVRAPRIEQNAFLLLQKFSELPNVSRVSANRKRGQPLLNAKVVEKARE